MEKLMGIGMIQAPVHFFAAHSHPHWEIVYYTYGTGCNTLDGADYPIEPGVILCQPPGVTHSERSENGFKNIHFMVEEFYYPGVAAPCCRDTENRDFYKILYQMYLEFHGKRQNYEKIIEGMLATLHQYLVSFLHQKPKNLWVNKLERFLIDNLNNPDMKVGEAMRRLPLDPDYLRRLFVRETGRTPSRYLADLRINHAKQLLAAGYGRIRDIAVMCGFEDPYYFSRLFRKVTGRSPSQWMEAQ